MSKKVRAKESGGDGGMSLWREIEEARLVRPAFEGMAMRGSTSMLAVPQWMDGGHIERLQAILRWGTRDRVVGVFENAEKVGAGFDGVAILKKELMGEMDKAKAAGVLARIAYATAYALRDTNFEVKRAIYRPQAGGKKRRDEDTVFQQGDLSLSKAGRKLWGKLFTINDYLPVCDPVYVAEAMDRMIARPALTSEKIGAEMLVGHVRKAVESALQEPVMKIIRKAIEVGDRTFEIDESEISAAAAMALSGADLGRFHKELQGLPGTQLVSVDSPLVRSLMLEREPERAARKKEEVLGILDGV